MPLQDFSLQLVGQYGYAGLIVALVLEFIGLPVPGETMMVFAGFQTWKGRLMLPESIVSAIIGTFSGSFIAYAIGKYLGRDMVYKYGRYIFLDKKKLDKVEQWFSQYGTWLFLFGRFIIGVRHLVPYVAGICKTRTRSFILYNMVGSLIWCMVFIIGGNILGRNWEKLMPDMHRLTLFLLITLGVCFIFFKLIQWIRHRNANNR